MVAKSNTSKGILLVVSSLVAGGGAGLGATKLDSQPSERLATVETKVNGMEKRLDSIDQKLEKYDGKLDKIIEKLYSK